MTRRPWARTLPDLVCEWSSLAPEADAVRPSTGPPLSYSALRRTMTRVAGALARRGIARADTVALLAPNVAEWIPAALGVSAAGARLAAFNTYVKPRELAYLLEHSQCSALVVAARSGRHSLLAPLQEVLPEAWEADPSSWRSPRFPHLRHVIVIGAEAPPGAERWVDVVDEAPGRDLRADDVGLPHVSAVDDAVVVYTSGSTARPKAVPLAHYGLVENGFAIGERMRLAPHDRVWLGSPLFWSYGVANAMMATFTHGAALVLQDEYDPDAAAELIQRERCTAAYLLPTILHDLSALPAADRAKLATLETGLTIGRPDEVALAVELGIADICNVYGATEVYGNCCVTPRDMPVEQRLQCQGPPLPGVGVRLRDPETGVPVEHGPGLIEVRGYTTRGYLGDPEQTAKAFTADGWYRTGDVGALLDDGSIRFVARGNDMIKTSGINVSPAEVEEFLSAHPDVARCVVVGAPDPQRGEVVVAVVEPVAGRAADPLALIAHCRQHIAAYKVPARVVVVDRLPTTDTGKIARRAAGQVAAAAPG